MSTYPSPASGPIPFASTVADLPLPVALERLFRAKSTGVVAIEARQGKHLIYLRDGYPVAVELPGSFDLLGKVLVEMKILDEASYQATLATPPPEGVRYGEILLSKGLVTEEQLRLALKAQVRRKLHRLYFLTDASIGFQATEHQEGLQRNESLRVHPWRANYHGVRSAWNADRLRQALAQLSARPLHTALTQEELARFGLGAEDGKVGILLRSGTHTLDTLSIDSGLPVQPVSALIYSLFVAAVLDDGTASPRAAAPPVMSSMMTPVPPPRSPSQPSVSQTQQGIAVMQPSANASQPSIPAAVRTQSQPSISAPAPGTATQSHVAIELEKVVHARQATIDTDDLFTVLGVQRTATTDEIKTAYLEAAKRYHPDRLGGLGLLHLRAQVERIFARVSEAQSTLLDEERRQAYVRTLDAPKSDDTKAHEQALSILHAEMAFKRGQHSLKKNDLAAALRDFEAALAANPEEGEHVVYVAWTRHCLGQLGPAETKTEMQRGLKLQPKCASAYYFLGMLQKEEGADDAALGSFKRAIDLDSRQFDAEQEIRILSIRKSKQTEKRGLFDRFRKK